jgi:Sec-independent protein translocase protein TatA
MFGNNLQFETVLILFFPAEESLDADCPSSMVTMMAEDPKFIIQDAQQWTNARRSQGRKHISPLTSGLLKSIARSIDEFKTGTRKEEEKESYEEDGDDEDQDEDNVKEIKMKTKPRNIPATAKAVDEYDDDCYDTSSGLWRMLSAYDDLVLSQPGYSTHQHGESHWLDADTVPWRTMEESRNKCLQWLEKHIEGQVSAVARGRH